MLFYNNALDLFCSVRIVFLINNVGRFQVRQYYESVPADSYKSTADTWRLMFEVLLVLMTCQRIIAELAEILDHFLDPKKSVREYFNIGNVVDWVGNVAICASVYVWVLMQNNSLQGVDLAGTGVAAIGTTDRLIVVAGY